MTNLEWKFYTQPQEAWDEMYADCQNAVKSIDLEQYILSNDEIGKKFIEMLKAKAAQGVRVRLLCDMVGSISLYNSNLVSELSKAGAQVYFFNPISPWRLHNFTSWFRRDHRKILIVDARVLHIGSVGIDDRMRYWRDTQVRIVGGLINSAQKTFDQMWRMAVTRQLGRSARLNSDTPGFALLTNSFTIKNTYLYNAFLNAIRSAKKYIYITTPYFVPDFRFFRAIRLAAKRGVIVKILLPGKSDLKTLDIAANSYFGLAMKAGVQIYQYSSERVLHAKTAIVDGEWATIGSCNFDNLSFKYNFEANVVSNDKNFNSTLENQFNDDLQNSLRLQEDQWKKRSLIQKVKEVSTWPIHPIL